MLFLRDGVSHLRFWNEIEDIYSYHCVTLHLKGCISLCHSSAKCLPQDSGSFIGCPLCARLCARHQTHTDPHRQGRGRHGKMHSEALWEAMSMPPDNSSLYTVCPCVGLPDYVIPEQLLYLDNKATPGPETDSGQPCSYAASRWQVRQQASP